MNIVSFFSGCGGMDLGFEQAGFDVIWANDNASSVRETYALNFPKTQFCNKSITEISIDDLPNDIMGIIGGPPCQSWSNAGKGLGLQDPRGKLFLTFIEILKSSQPLFFVAENVKGIKSARNADAYKRIYASLSDCGYDVTETCVNAADYGVPQSRERVFFIGFRRDLNIQFRFPEKLSTPKKTVRDAIEDLSMSAVPMGQIPVINAHEYWTGGYSYIFMSRNRVLDWNSTSFTIQASGRQTSIHPQAPFMEHVATDVCQFKPGYEYLYRRLSARECARLQTFPDSFIFKYSNLNDVYKMIGNAVPVNLAFHIARSIRKALESADYNK